MDQGLIFLILLSFLTGVAAGYLSGLLGIGSGIIMVPAAIFLLDVGFREAKAISLFVIMFTAPIGMWRHHTHGNLHFRTGLYLGVPGVCGSLIGVYLAGLLDITYLKVLFAFVQFYAAYRMIHRYGEKKTKVTIEHGHEAYGVHKGYLPFFGFIGGLSAGLLGIGGGVIMVPSMAFLSYPIHSSIANSLMVISMNAVAGTAAHSIRGELKIFQAIPMMLGAVLSVHKGADMSVSIDRDKLRKYFGYFMILMGIYMLYKGYFG